MSGGEFQAGEIEAEANKHAERFAKEFLPHGVREGRYWSCYNLEGHKSQSGKRSLRLNLSGGNIGLWKDFGSGEGGDIVKLVAIKRFGGTDTKAFADAYSWLKSTLGMDGLDPERIKARKAAIAAEVEQRQKEASQETERKRSRAAWLWHGADPIRRTPAQAYLEGRGIDFEALGKLPGALRFRPDCGHPERHGKKFAAMIAGIWRLGEAKPCAIHRTYLDMRAWHFDAKTGRVPKLSGVNNAKLSMGEYRGGCIPLWKGSCDKPLVDIDEGTPVFVSEGIEDGLSWAMGHPEDRVLAAVALSNIGGVELPPQAGPLTIIMQNDAPGSKAIEQIENAIRRQQAAGRLVDVVTPPPEYKDFNDLLMGKPKQKEEEQDDERE